MEIQAGLRAFDFNLRFRERILSVLFGRGVQYALFREAMEKARLWSRRAEISGQAYGFPPGVFWSVLMLDGVLLVLASFESDPASLTSSEIFDTVFSRILRLDDGILERPFILPGGNADALRALTSFTRQWAMEACRRGPASILTSIDGDMNRDLSSVVKHLFSDGFSHAAVVVSSSGLSSSVSASAGVGSAGDAICEQFTIRRGIDVISGPLIASTARLTIRSSCVRCRRAGKMTQDRQPKMASERKGLGVI